MIHNSAYVPQWGNEVTNAVHYIIVQTVFVNVSVMTVICHLEQLHADDYRSRIERINRRYHSSFMNGRFILFEIKCRPRLFVCFYSGQTEPG